MIVLDHACTLLGVVAWMAAGVTAALRRAGPALVLLAVALVLTAARAVPMEVLAGRGWWFVQESAVARFEVGGTVPTLPVLERLAAPRDAGA
ncbi:hypothetical protein ACWER9_09685 [Micromonospora sp. NPDC003944]